MVELKVALRESRTLGSQFKSSIDSIGKMGEMTNCVTTHQFDRDRAESRAPPPADRRTRRTSGEQQWRISQSNGANCLVEVWHEPNPGKVEYSCHYSTLKTCSPIDYFPVSRELLSQMKNCWHSCIVISDHGPVC